MRIGIAAVACAFALLVPLASAAVPGGPSRGKIVLGVVGPDPASFDRLTGRHHPLHVMFGNWTGPVAEIVEGEHREGRLPVLSLPMGLSPADVAGGAEDARWIALSRALNQTGKDVWVRVFPEMTGYWNTWCAYNENGSARGPKYTTRQFVTAFRRVATILRGGSVNARLRAAKLRPAAGADNLPRSSRVAIVWNPQGHGVPFIPANGPRAYWPGPAYVDIVADDMYSDSAEPSWKGMDVLYAYGKPYLVAEWGLEAEDDLPFAKRMLDWVAKHPRTVGLVYFNKGWSGGSGIYELRSKPRSLAHYKRAIKNPRFLAALP